MYNFGCQYHVALSYFPMWARITEIPGPTNAAIRPADDFRTRRRLRPPKDGAVVEETWRSLTPHKSALISTPRRARCSALILTSAHSSAKGFRAILKPNR